VTDLERLVRDGPELVQKFPALDLTSEQYQQLSPLHFASSDDPPTLIIHGDQDALVPLVEGESMYQALMQSEVRTEFMAIEGAEHGFVGEHADSALAEAVSWFEEHLRRR
jgi:dipeptidyl aminopeptidase/acylaminoacyl peptidase